MPNQNKCDHVVSVDCYMGRTDIKCKSRPIFQSEIISRRADIGRGMMAQLSYCPDCGAKIDWEAIKEACDER